MPFIAMYLMVLLVIFLISFIIMAPIAILVLIFKGLVAIWRAWRNRKPGRGECSWQGCHRRAEAEWHGAPVCGMHWCAADEHIEVHWRKT